MRTYSKLKHTYVYETNTGYSTRIFLLFPSHYYYLMGAATTGCGKYGTPIGDLTVHTELVAKIKKEWDLEVMSRSVGGP